MAVNLEIPLRDLFELFALTRDGAITTCWSPVTEMVDEGGHLAERACGACSPCRLADVLERLAPLRDKA